LAKGKITAQQLKHDPLMDKYIASSGWVKERSRPLLKGLIAIAAIGVAALVFYLISSQRERAAAEALAAAFRVDQAIVADPVPPNEIAFPTQDAKHRAASDAFEKAARDYPSYYGEMARYYAATHQLNFDAPKAEATLQELAQKNSSVGAQARLALAERYEATGRFNEALAEYQKLKTQPGDISPSLVDFSTARTYEAMGKTKEAVDLYFSVASEGQSSLGTISITRMAVLDPARIEQLPNQEKSKMPSFGGMTLPKN
jgi:tetratricopeptide (TPR) repeat protein